MTVDILIQQDLVNFRRNLIQCFKMQHPHIFSILERVFAGRENMVGIQITENGTVVGKYTLLMDGINVVEARAGSLDSALHHPLLGVVKPYVIIERSVVEKLVKDERFKTEIFTSITHYLPDITIKFLR